jgi:alpha-L-rhamnosidase
MMPLHLLVGSGLLPASESTVPAPVGLLVDLIEVQAAPYLAVTASLHPRFTFNTGSYVLPMSAYEITISGDGGPAVWSSGKIAATSAVNILCNATLVAGAKYSYAAQYYTAAGTASAVTTSPFGVGPSVAQWKGAAWLGGGQRQFKIEVPSGAESSTLYIATPGGATVEMDGAFIGDEVGVSLWTNVLANTAYIAYVIPRSSSSTPSSIIITAGGGFYVSKHAHGAGTDPIVKFMFLSATGAELQSSSDAAKLRGRVGPVLSDDPWHGTMTDTTVAPDADWTAAAEATPKEVPAATHYFPLPAPYSRTRGSFAPLSVRKVAGRGPGVFLYKFPANIVGHASVKAGAASGTGNITLEFCEVYNATLEGTTGGTGCLPFLVPPPGGFKKGTIIPCGSFHGCDTYIISSSSETTRNSAADLSPRFTWHGFQYVTVVASPGECSFIYRYISRESCSQFDSLPLTSFNYVTEGVTFSGALDALSAHWTTADLTDSARISFGGGTGSGTLSSIRDIAKHSQIANLAAFMPTDCPTREKHGWLGDAQVTAENAMYNYWAPGIYSIFLSQIRDSQRTTAPNLGFVTGVVPIAGQASAAVPNNVTGKSSALDISWTAAYPLVAGWIFRYYGDLDSVREHYPSIKAYIDGNLNTAKTIGSPDAMPNFYTWGDWCAVESRAACTPGTGAIAASANFLLALQSIEAIATALGESSDAARWDAQYKRLSAAFDARFWNDAAGTWTTDSMEVQTITSIVLGAGVGSAAHRTIAVATLAANVAKYDNHLTVGSAGQKWLLRTLSKEGHHDVALKVATQTTYPSWGYWISLGATTCWENWSGGYDASHPPVPTHNHIFLCGGVGEWMYEYLAGVIPTSAGYASVDVKPMISKTIGPATVNAAVTTVRDVSFSCLLVLFVCSYSFVSSILLFTLFFCRCGGSSSRTGRG